MLSCYHQFWVTDEFMFAMFVAQIGTMKCFYCPQKDVSLVPSDSLSPADQTFLWDKYPDAGQGAVCDLCFALHATACSSATVLRLPHHRLPNQWTLGCRLLQLCVLKPHLWPQSQWNLGLSSLQRLLQSLLLLPQGQDLPQTHPAHHSQMVRRCA